MLRLFWVLSLSVVLYGCNHSNQKIKAQAKVGKDSLAVDNSNRSNNGRRNLKYLFYANGGLLGFFDDGSVAGCPKCQPCIENIEALNEMKPHAKYAEERAFLVYLNGGAGDTMRFNDTGIPGNWAMINYKWKINLLSCADSTAANE